ncbi:MAG: hypothetical protein HWD86_11895 [Kangiellaceae bacterium]|nr:hypothetical protein [Kangiellaceae bacterium]
MGKVTNHRRWLVIGLVVGSLLSCDSNTGYRGYLTEGFEWSYFVECDSQEKWWLKNTPTMMDLRKKLSNKGVKFVYDMSQTNPTVYVSVTGQLSEKGQWGHLGQYPRQLAINKYQAYSMDKQDICG